jgi:dTDP-glucose 4,6-dehydratase
MRVLVTGGSGFAGSHLIEHFLENTDWELVSFDSYRHKGDDLRHLNSHRVKYIAHDCGTPVSHRLSETLGDFDYIINLAADSHVDRSIDDPVPFVENNMRIALFMCQFARTQPNLKAFVQVSTDEVYGAAPDGVDHKEWSPILPSNPYSASKAAQEAICISYWRTYGLPLIITNTLNMVGERQDAEKFVPLCIKKIISGEEVPIHGNDKYIGKRKYLHARNHADAILFILKNITPVQYVDSDETVFPDRYNVAGDTELNNLDVAKLISDILGLKLKYKLVDFHSARPGHDRRYSLSDEKLKRLGWKPPYMFSEYIEKVVNWSVANGVWL